MVWEVKPRSVLDVGVGFGKYGLLLREFVGCPPIERLEGIEAWQPYVDNFPWLQCIYDRVQVGSVLNLTRAELAEFDLVLMVDVLEHLDKDAGHALLNRIDGHVVICTPAEFFQNPEAEERPPEMHRSLWSVEDFAGPRLQLGYERLGGVLIRLSPADTGS